VGVIGACDANIDVGPTELAGLGAAWSVKRLLDARVPQVRQVHDQLDEPTRRLLNVGVSVDVIGSGDANVDVGPTELVGLGAAWSVKRLLDARVPRVRQVHDQLDEPTRRLRERERGRER
jgi:hypothetical protein